MDVGRRCESRFEDTEALAPVTFGHLEGLCMQLLRAGGSHWYGQTRKTSGSSSWINRVTNLVARALDHLSRPSLKRRVKEDYTADGP